MRRRAGWRTVLVMGAALALLSACGVPLQSAAEPLPSDIVPMPVTAPRPSPPETPASAVPPSSGSTIAGSRLRLWFVLQDGLVAAESALPAGSSPELIVQALVDGPGATALSEGLRTLARDPLTGQPMVMTSTVLPTASPVPASPPPSPAAVPVSVQLGSAFSSLPSAEQVLVLGQVVLSLTGAGASSVAFTSESGSPVAVPLPDGRLLDRPATVRDFTSLIIRP